MLILAARPPRHDRQRARSIRREKRADREFGRTEAGQVGKRIHRPVEIVESVSRDIFGDRDRLEAMRQPRRHRAENIDRRRMVAG